MLYTTKTSALPTSVPQQGMTGHRKLEPRVYITPSSGPIAKDQIIGIAIGEAIGGLVLVGAFICACLKCAYS